MAGGGLKLELDEALSERLKAAASALGRSVDDYAAELIADGLDQDGSDDPDPAIDEKIADETLARGDGAPWDVYRTRFDTFGRR